MTLHTLPWQDIGAALLGVLALAHLLRRWWPGRTRASASSCHDTTAPPPTGGSACGSCSGCPSRRP